MPAVVDASRVGGREALVRVVTCGGVDDGKSTLLGCLLHECGAVFDDQWDALQRDSRVHGTRGGDADYALLLDGLGTEREQGITIDVAHRYFSRAGRKYIVLDAPGHERYTRNMVSGASLADVAVVLVDASKGIAAQTRRHSYILALLRVPRVVLAISKMDLVSYARDAFDAIAAAYRSLARDIGLPHVTCIPVCAVNGDNVARRTARMPWFDGPALLDCLDAVDCVAAGSERPWRMPVQWVTRASDGFRGCCGTIVSGTVRPGDRVVVQPSGVETEVARIVTFDGDLPAASVQQAVAVTFRDRVDAGRGDVLSSAAAPLEVADQFQAALVWMDDAPLLRGRTYRMRIGTREVTATVAPLKYKVNLESLEHVAADTLEQNEIGVCELELDRDIPFAPYADNPHLGGFILIDRITNRTVAAGMLRFALRRARNVTWQAFDIDKVARAAAKAQKPCVVWFTGLSGAGKSTIANLVEKRLHASGLHTYVLDGDNVRKGLTKDLGFTDEDRVENIRRVAEVAALMVDAGLIVITAFISPFRSERAMARGRVRPEEFVEVFVDTPLAVAERRDPKGLYRKARSGALTNFTGIDSPYERPERAEIVIDGSAGTPEAAAERIVDELRRRGIFDA